MHCYAEHRIFWKPHGQGEPIHLAGIYDIRRFYCDPLHKICCCWLSARESQSDAGVRSKIDLHAKDSGHRIPDTCTIGSIATLVNFMHRLWLPSHIGQFLLMARSLISSIMNNSANRTKNIPVPCKMIRFMARNYNFLGNFHFLPTFCALLLSGFLSPSSTFPRNSLQFHVCCSSDTCLVSLERAVYSQINYNSTGTESAEWRNAVAGHGGRKQHTNGCLVLITNIKYPLNSDVRPNYSRSWQILNATRPSPAHILMRSVYNYMVHNDMVIRSCRKCIPGFRWYAPNWICHLFSVCLIVRFCCFSCRCSPFFMAACRVFVVLHSCLPSIFVIRSRPPSRAFAARILPFTSLHRP